ncbi:hypothetical protein ACX1RH_000488 [Enterococcus hirae]
MNVLLVDDEPLITEGIEKLLKKQPVTQKISRHLKQLPVLKH